MDKTYSNPDGFHAETESKYKARQEAHGSADKDKEEGRDLSADRKKAAADEIGGIAESLSALLSELTEEVSTLIQHELQLAKDEVSEKVSQAGVGVASIVAAGAVAFGGFLVFLQAIVYGLADILDGGDDTSSIWIASLIVGVVVLLIGYGLLRKGQSDLKANNLALPRTVESLRQDKNMVEEEVRENRSRYDETY